MIFGYQGAYGSNSFVAAQCIAEEVKLDDFMEYVPLIDAEGVVRALTEGSIDYGVIAVNNKIGGPVKETIKALENQDYEIIHTHVLPVHHCLFKLQSVPLEDVHFVASHPQALKQTRESRAQKFNQLEEVEIPDTALGAKWLADGTLTPDTAVLCRDIAGQINELDLVAANLEDDNNDCTEFQLIRLSSN